MTQDTLSSDTLMQNRVSDSSLEPMVTWQDQDDQLRTLWHQKVSPEDIAEKLGRSVAAVMTRAARLGLPRRAAPGRKRGYKRTDASQCAKKITVAMRTKVVRQATSTREEEESSEVMQRVCLMCLKKFKSLGRHNRICPACKGSADYATGSSTPDFICDIGK